MEDFRSNPLVVAPEEVEQQQADSLMSHMRMREGTKPSKQLLALFNNYLGNKYHMWPRMDAQEFGHRWLPYFHIDNFKEGCPIFEFVTLVTGNPYRGCLLTHKGEVVCIVPPIYDADAAPALKEGEDIFIQEQIVGRSIYQTQANREVAAQNIITNGLIPLVNKQPRRLSEGYFMMNKVFEFFGVERRKPDWVKELEAKQLAEETGVTLETNVAAKKIDEDRYDDMEEE